MAKSEHIRTVTCPYCRQIIPHHESQKDHVPPKGLFGKPRPSNLITVRCCDACHRALSKGDEVLKAIAAMGLIRTDARHQIDNEIRRALERNPWWKSHLIDATKEVVPVGIAYKGQTDVGYRIPLRPDLSEAIDATIRRIAIGLIFSKTPDWDATKHTFEVIQASEEQPLELIAQLQPCFPLPFQVSLGHRVFLAAWGFARNSADHGVMVLSLFGGLIYAVLIAPKS